MILRVGLFHRLIYDGQEYGGGDTFEVPDDVALNLLRTGLVNPADGDWPGEALQAVAGPHTAAAVPAMEESAQDPAVHDAADRH